MTTHIVRTYIFIVSEEMEANSSCQNQFHVSLNNNGQEALDDRTFL